MMIGRNNGRRVIRDKGNGMIMNTTGRGNSLGSGTNSLMFEEDGLDIKMHIGCLSGLDGMDFFNNVGMTFLEEVFHAMEINDLKGTYCDSLEHILLSLLV